MVDKIITRQELVDAQKDAQTLEDVINGAPNVLIDTRLGRKVYTLASVPQINTMSRDEVTSALAPKADKTETAAALDTKANQADTFLKSEVTGLVAPKADKTYVDSAIGAISTDASKQYATLALANADIANIAINKNIFVSEAANGGYWYKATAGATSLTKSPYDPLIQAKADATTKANAAEANAKSYTENAILISALSGTDIYYRAKENPSKTFQAIWSKYNKPVWHIGGGVIVDTTGATLKTVEEELVFTVKLTATNETFIYPTRSSGTQIIDANIDWGDGATSNHTNYLISHTYTGSIGTEFQIKLKGVMPEFDFSTSNSARRTSRLMLKSIDKNTMPKVMTVFDLAGCTNLTYLCRGAYSSYNNGTTFKPEYALYSPSISFHPKAFEGLESVTDISGMFGKVGSVINFNIPAGLLDVFVNTTTASYLFYGLSKPLPVGILDKLVNLENVSYMFSSATITSIDNRIFKNQTKLKNVSQCFRLSSSLVADAYQLYTDMNQGLPTTVNGCFLNVNAMTNLASVPTTWKTL